MWASCSSVISSVLASSGGVPTTSHSASASVSLNTWRTLSGSTSSADSGSRVNRSPSTRIRPDPSSTTYSSVCVKCLWRVDDWPGASRHSRAPRSLASSCLARSVFITFIWFDGRQNASAAGSAR
jgi:hypothetical protein